MFTKSKLGFGLMRLPRLSDGKIDLEQLKKMVDIYMAAGLNYFDTAYAYEGSEEATKEALVMRYQRDSYTIADKLPAWELKSSEDKNRVFEESLARLGVDYIDFYLIHAVGEDHLKIYDKFDCWNFARELKAEGKIKHWGFSFHDTPLLLDKLLTEHADADFVQLQINYLDWESKSVYSREVYEVARSHGKPIIIMEPVKGGQLAVLPEREKRAFDRVYPDQTPASLALRYAASLDGVMTVLSGMSDIAQIEDNVKTFTSFKKFDEKDRALVKEILDGFSSYDTIPCTRCAYCEKGCPMGIKIPRLFSVSNRFTMYGDKADAQSRYDRAVKDSSPASACAKCGQCENVCPQHIKIISELEKISEIFG